MKNSIGPSDKKNLRKEYLRSGRHLFYSEGTKTEQNYASSISESFSPAYSGKNAGIELVNANPAYTPNTTGIVNYAFNDVKSRLKSREQINHVWIFFDKDDFSLSKFKSANKMCNEKNNSKNKNDDGFFFNIKDKISYHAIYSNECFELFCLLYFNYKHSSLSRNIYSEKLCCYIKAKNPGVDFHYEKNAEHMHQTLTNFGGSIKSAIKFAKSLEKENSLNNPSTHIYEFAEYFSKYFE